MATRAAVPFFCDAGDILRPPYQHIENDAVLPSEHINRYASGRNRQVSVQAKAATGLKPEA
jgi:hypothetical protein